MASERRMEMDTVTMKPMRIEQQAVLGDMLNEAGHVVVINEKGELIWGENPYIVGYKVIQPQEITPVRGPRTELVVPVDMSVNAVFNAIMAAVQPPDLNRQQRLWKLLEGKELGGWRFQLGCGLWGLSTVEYCIGAPFTSDISVIRSFNPYKSLDVLIPRPVAIGYVERHLATVNTLDDAIFLLESIWGTKIRTE